MAETASITDTANGAAAAAHGSGGLPQFDLSLWPGQIFWLLVVFGVFYLILDKVLLPRISGLIKERRQTIESNAFEAQTLQGEIEAARHRADSAVAEARARGAQLASEARKSVEADIAKAKNESEASLAKDIEAAEQKIRDAQAKAMESVHTIAADVTTAIVQKLTGQNISGDEAVKAAARTDA